LSISRGSKVGIEERVGVREFHILESSMLGMNLSSGSGVGDKRPQERRRELEVDLQVKSL
jgi:hypothetical protein